MYHKSVAQKMRHCWNDVESLMKCYSSSWQGGIGGDWRFQWSCWYGRSRLGMLARRIQLWHLAEDGDIRNRWSGYYSGLLNETNPKEQLQNVPETAGEVAVEHIINQLAKRKGNKACDPDLIPNVGKDWEQGIVFLEKELNEVMTSGIPSTWRLCELTPLFKWKGFLLECSNYRVRMHDTPIA